MMMITSNGVRAIKTVGRRTFFASQGPKVALDEEFPGLPQNVPRVPTEAPVTSETTLSNGVRVVSHDDHGLASSIGIFLRGGSRAETDALRGASHLISQMAFVQRSVDKTGLRIVRDIENAGGVCWSGNDRESVHFAATCLRPNVRACMESVADVALRSAFRPWDVAEGRDRVSNALSATPVHERLEDALFSAAFYDNQTLGRPTLAQADGLGNLTGPALATFMGELCDPSNIVVAGYSVHHSDLVDLAEAFCGHLNGDADASSVAVSAEYVGGEARVRTSDANTTISLGFPTNGATDAANSAVLAEILGNGSVYTRGRGAGQGNTRLGKAVADAGFVLNANGFSASYSDAGLVGVTAQVSADQADAAVEFMAVAMKSVASGVTEQEVSSAKARLTLKQADASSKAKLQHLASSGDVVSSLGAVTAASVSAMAKSAVASAPSVASIGNIDAVPRYNRVQDVCRA